MSQTTSLRRQLAEYRMAGLVVGLMGIGLVALSSAAPEGSGIWVKQLVWYGLGLLVMVGVSRLDYRWIADQAGLLILAVLIMLALVQVMGVIGGGSQRWIGLGPIRIQPSEAAKLAVILWLARWAALRPHPGGAHLIHLLVPGVVLGLVTGLVLIQPDLGTAVAILLVGLGVLFVAGIKRRVLGGLAATGGGAAILAWYFVLRPYQKRRVFGFLDPEADPMGIGYHTIQSKIAIGAGGVWGQGFGQGSQARLRFLPEQHTDFIFSVWAEEWGFVGGLLLLALFAGLLLWVARTALESRDALGRLLASGILAHLVLHTGINLAMTLGLAPVVGLPLPWLTYGGAEVLTNSALIGLILSIRLRRQWF